ncbi:MAG: putative ribonuclease H [Prokaryotic dsDNA virus sp.]|nr:MAG: putative ribonuclease H [Prokaryotic dsDNA virus sp.]|tara:strand:- start:20298 stop:21137 length:840 start_codon:yes stop_codon:yes gene_type:complete
MLPLIDADILVYEAAFGGEDRETGEVYGFDYVSALIDRKIEEICHAVGATEPPLLFLTGKGNFREGISTVKPYKGNRKQPKPYHYLNVRAYLESLGAITVEGMEADDALAIAQTEDWNSTWKVANGLEPEPKDRSCFKTVIVTRDKDLRQVAGWHYGWEHGAQPEFPLQFVDELGDIELIDKTPKEIKGTGLKFFYSQLITGDTVDNIPGLPRKGAVYAYKILKECDDEGSMFKAVREAYRQVYDDEGDERLLEQGRLLWMVRELDAEGEPKMWEFPDG